MRRATLITPVTILLGTLLGAAAWAEGPAEKASLTLEEAVALALERNQQVLIARAQADVLKGRYREVRAQALPSLTFNGSALRWRDPSFLNSSSFDKIPADFRDALQVTPANLFDYNVSVSQPLYTSGKVGTALKLASLETEGVGVDGARVEQDIRLRVIRAFYDLILAERLLDVSRAAVQQRQMHLDMARTRYAAGVATEVDVLRSQVSVANAQPELIRSENSVRHARSVLNNLLVRPVDYPTVVLGELTFIPQAKTEAQQIARQAVEHRPEMQRLRINELEAESQKKLANAENRLRVDLNGQYGFSARDPANLWNHNFTRFMFTVSVALPIFDGGRRSGLFQQAVAQRKVTELARSEQENVVRLEVQTALDELERAEKTVEAARLNVHEAERVLTMTQDNYRYGAATTLDVIDAQAALTAARWNLLQGLHDHMLARAQLRWVMGLDPLEKAEPLSGDGHGGN
ncbi:MAG: TolC family protein [Terriglobia bacterium]